MDKQELIDKAVDALGGRLMDASDSFVVIDNWTKTFISLSVSGGMPTKQINDHEFICHADEFTARALELGWVSGFKWGVEYPTNGKKPDLPGTLFVKHQHKTDGKWLNNPFPVDSWAWEETGKAFKIVDERYKPKEPEQQTKRIKDLSDVIFAVSDAISVAVDAGAMPAARELQKINRDLLAKDSVVGIGQYELQAKPNNSWHDPEMSKECPNGFPFIGCLAEHINWGMPIKIKFLGERFFIAEKTDASNGKDREVCGFIGDLHPIKNERERFVEAALTAADKFKPECDITFAQALYDAGFKAPDEKSRK